MLNKLKEKVEYRHDGLYWKSGQTPGKRIGSLAPNGYRYVRTNLEGKKKTYLEHRLCFYYMKGRWPTEIDHIDRDKTNNAWSNLRECTRSENNRNKVNNKGIKKSCQKFTVELRHKGQYYYIGRFNTYDEALEARKEAEIKIWS